MSAIINTIVGLCFFRGGPEDLPASSQWVYITGLLALLAYLVTSPDSQPGPAILGVAIVQVVFLGLIIALILQWNRRPERWAQTTTALFGTGTVIQLAGWPVSLWIEQVKDNPEEIGLPFLLIIILGLWYLVVMASILKRAMEITTGQSLMLSFLCQFMLVLVLLIFFGGAMLNSGI